LKDTLDGSNSLDIAKEKIRELNEYTQKLSKTEVRKRKTESKRRKEEKRTGELMDFLCNWSF
jgi:hypothetical protein